jgi:hypothetical protein
MEGARGNFSAQKLKMGSNGAAVKLASILMAEFLIIPKITLTPNFPFLESTFKINRVNSPNPKLLFFKDSSQYSAIICLYIQDFLLLNRNLSYARIHFRKKLTMVLATKQILPCPMFARKPTKK